MFVFVSSVLNYNVLLLAFISKKSTIVLLEFLLQVFNSFSFIGTLLFTFIFAKEKNYSLLELALQHSIISFKTTTQFNCSLESTSCISDVCVFFSFYSTLIILTFPVTFLLLLLFSSQYIESYTKKHTLYILCFFVTDIVLALSIFLNGMQFHAVLHVIFIYL